MSVRAVGLNLSFWVEGSGGMGRYAQELLPALLGARPGLRLVAFHTRDLPPAARAEPWARDLDWVRLPVPGSGGGPAGAGGRLGAQWLALPVLARRHRVEVLHGLANVVAPVAPGVATVVTFHDLIWLRHPQSMSRVAELSMKATALPSVRRADRVITPSLAAKDDLVRTLGIDPDRIDAIPHGIRPGRWAQPEPEAAVRERLALGDRPVLLSVAQKRPYKNLALLIRALPSLDDAVAVLVGGPTPHEAELRELATRLGVADRVRFEGWIDDAALEGLYDLAAAVVLPSVEEGFGMPVLEAMARDVPVACADISALPEAAGGAAALFDPHDPASLADAVRPLLAPGPRRDELRAKGRERAAQMTWERAAQATLETYDRASAARQ